MNVSAIVPTIGRPDSLRILLCSLARQSVMPIEVIIADGSSNSDSLSVCNDPVWQHSGLSVKHLFVLPPNAVKQRTAAITVAQGSGLLLLDDDVQLERDCLERLIDALNSNHGAVAVMADFNNQPWPEPTTAWQLYLRYSLRLPEGSWHGRVVGPLLRFGFPVTPKENQRVEWFGTCNSLVRREAFLEAGGFSDFFLHRCTINEDVDLALKVGRVGRILFCPAARLAHYHAPAGRVSTRDAAEDDIYNRYMILHKTVGHSAAKAFGLVLSYVLIEGASNVLGAVKRRRRGEVFSRMTGHLRGLFRIVGL